MSLIKCRIFIFFIISKFLDGEKTLLRNLQHSMSALDNVSVMSYNKPNCLLNVFSELPTYCKCMVCQCI